jgi:uncharacterized RDD family membrane protein YckC
LSTSVPTFPKEPVHAGSLSHTNSIGSLWHRLLAYLIDVLILGAVGSGVGNAFFDKLSHMGPWGRLVGFSIALPYFAIMESSIGGGQSFGKLCLKLKVVDAQGNTISFGKSLARYVMFAVPSFLFEIALPVTRTPWILSTLISVFVLGVGGSTLYLITFNRDTRQGLHDLAVGSYVAKAGDTGPVEARPIATKHWATLGSLLIILAVLAGIQSNILVKRGPLPQMRQDARMIEQMDGVQQARVQDFMLHNRSGGGAKKSLDFSIRTEKPVDQEAFADEVAKIVLQNDRYAQEYDQLTIRILRGYDIGIASHWNHQEFTHSPDEWRQRVLGASPVSNPTPTRQ